MRKLKMSSYIGNANDIDEMFGVSDESKKQQS
jgi:hypothetical protein